MKPRALRTQTYHAAVRAFRCYLITESLRAHQGRRAETARALGITRANLQQFIREFGIDVPSISAIRQPRDPRGRIVGPGGHAVQGDRLEG